MRRVVFLILSKFNVKPNINSHETVVMGYHCVPGTVPGLIHETAEKETEAQKGG